ncbi:TerC family protein [Desulfitobacterium sp.]|uniref:TerC family protein n=1 Tax=Desulfitobacterium sp. TaxID=49981 RepID=UPI002B1EED37|nr:TerC family protein [Desulfitobacterium sp.]MEA4903013.1 TerC family protein [Desulfitobacterium sp.]
MEFVSALFSIILMDLVLGGDNAIFIGMAVRNLPHKNQKKAIFIGTGGAIVIRTIATVVAVWLLKIPGLMLVGGLFLVKMAYNLLNEKKGDEESHIESSANLWSAVRTIIIADAVMGLDNVLAVAGAANGSPLLVVCGLSISIPIVVLGSTLITKAIERFPIILPIGAAVIIHTAVKMMLGEPFIQNYVGKSLFLEIGFSVVLIAAVLILSYKKKVAEKLV